MSSVKKIARKIMPKKAISSVEKRYRLGKAKAANVIYQFPAKNMKVIAVTGTNGKTTTCAYINEVLKAAGYKTAVYTTAFLEIAGKNEFNRTHMTIASAWVVQKFFARAKKAGAEWVILEVTSHALDQYRILGVPVEIAVVTNISQDHLDYHGTMQNYAAAKARLITDFDPKCTILNADDEWYEFFAGKVKNHLVTIGRGRATDQLKEVNLSPKGCDYKIVSPKGVLKIQTSLVGDFNVYNSALGAVVGQVLGVDSSSIVKGVSNVLLVPGRMENIDEGQPFVVLVDYAVTPDALEKALATLHDVTKGKVRVVFGATGDRDKGKRPIMGEVAARWADMIYLTDDETYTEDGDAIRAAVRGGIMAGGGQDKFIEIPDRLEAIKQAFSDAKEGDVVILAGIGHEDYRNQGGKKIPWDEREIARSVLAGLMRSS